MDHFLTQLKFVYLPTKPRKTVASLGLWASVTDNNLTCQIDKNLQAVQQLNCLSETLLTLRV